jgi:Family of unknown function (DUF6636)
VEFRVVRRLAIGLLLGTICLVAAASALAKTPIPGVRTPTGNIECLYVPGQPPTLRCDIRGSSYGTTLQNRCMARETVDWHGFELTTTRKARVTCSGGILYRPDTQMPVYRTLSYGKTWKHDGFTCASARTGLTCRNRKGHGLFISRESWRLW